MLYIHIFLFCYGVTGILAAPSGVVSFLGWLCALTNALAILANLPSKDDPKDEK